MPPASISSFPTPTVVMVVTNSPAQSAEFIIRLRYSRTLDVIDSQQNPPAERSNLRSGRCVPPAGPAMSGSVVLLHLAGAVALMLFATRMVRTGVERAYGDVLRHRLRATMRNPIMAVLAGTALAIAFQSSTAVTLLVGSFAGAGIVSGMAGQLAVRGAEIGSALVVKLLSFDLTLLVPLALVAGTTMFLATERRDWRQFGRILVGIGLLVLSLQMIGQSSEPLRDSKLLPVIVDYFSSDPVTAYLLAALTTWLFHSSIAAVLLLVTLAGRGFIPPELGIVLVLGVNLGSSVIAPLLTRRAEPGVRVVPIGNLLMRGVGSLLMLIAFLWLKPPIGLLGADAGDQIINAHILFNCLILLAGLPLARPIYRLSERIVALGTPPAAGRCLRRRRAQRARRKGARHAGAGARQCDP